MELEQCEKTVIEKAKRLEQARLEEQEAERLRQEVTYYENASVWEGSIYISHIVSIDSHINIKK